jgi:hypothetical protein
MGRAMSKYQFGRLAFRADGADWIVYFAKVGTMDGAIEMARIKMALVEDPELKQQFQSFMQAAVTVSIKEATGLAASWPDPPQPAPENERGGSA